MELYGFCQGYRARPLSRIVSRTEEGLSVNITYYFWCIKHEGRAILVDTGLSEEARRERKLQQTAAVPECLEAVGVRPDDVEEVIVTHLHSDHFSMASLYPNAVFYVQEKDLMFFSGPSVRFDYLGHAASDMKEVMQLLYDGRFKVLNGDFKLRDRITLKLVGGHTPGSQIVIMSGKAGQPVAVVCGDAVDLHENIRRMSPSPLVVSMLESLETMEFIKSLGVDDRFVLCGHDPAPSTTFERIGGGPAFRIL